MTNRSEKLFFFFCTHKRWDFFSFFTQCALSSNLRYSELASLYLHAFELTELAK